MHSAASESSADNLSARITKAGECRMLTPGVHRHVAELSVSVVYSAIFQNGKGKHVDVLYACCHSHGDMLLGLIPACLVCCSR